MTSLTTRADIAAITQARLEFGRRHQALDTATSLAFALDHAKARMAVTSELDVAQVGAALERAGLEYSEVSSAAPSRDVYIKRPDLGRTLAEGGRVPSNPVDVALVLGDGLSAIAVALNGAAFMTALAQRLDAQGLSYGIVLARQARVALGDAIARQMPAQTVVMALGERPGLSAADSLGVYITHTPQQATPDSARNCISNIRDAGTGISDASARAEHLILAMRDTGQSGVALNQTLEAGGRLTAT